MCRLDLLLVLILAGFTPSPPPAVGVAPLHHAQHVRFSRRVQRVVLPRHREPRGEEVRDGRAPAVSPASHPQALHAAQDQEGCGARDGRKGGWVEGAWAVFS